MKLLIFRLVQAIAAEATPDFARRNAIMRLSAYDGENSVSGSK
jgi:hypothetical protein